MAQDIVQRACAKLGSAIEDEAVVRSNFIDDLRYMLGALESIQPVLENSEMKQFRSISVANWLQLVCSAAYKTIDTVNELHDARPQAAATLTRMLPHLAIVKNAMAIEVQETKKLVMQAQEMSSRFPNYPKITEEPKTRPVSEEAMIFGRGSDKERIIAALLSTKPNNIQEHITILPIFGLAGSGKTTLAQMVFNDTHSLQGYDFRVWFHVSPQLDFHALGNSIICHVLERGQEASDMEGMQGIMKRLHELLHRKKVLLILDDLWEEDPIQLQLLKSMLTFLGDEMDVIVTTGNQAIARNICTVEPYRLNRLSDDTCWEIIKKSICFEGENELEKIGREIATKCLGVPLVAREYARMLYSSRDAMTWQKSMEENVWLNIIKAGVPLSLARFELNYKSMSPYLRLCFDYYCAVFPTGNNIVKDDLVHQWIALHLIEPSETLSAAQIAEEHITRLQNMSFLQTAELDHASGANKGAILLTMHGVVHNLATMFLENSSYHLATNHHGKLDVPYGKYIRALRCVGCSNVEFKGGSFPHEKWLRVLELTESSMLKLPDYILQLKHLRYLKITEFSGLITLPESLGELINLIHINLSGCTGLLNLPGSFGKLTRLMHANLSGCSGLATLPESFGDLIELSHVNLSRCHGLAELPEQLQNLGKMAHLDLSFWSCFEGIGERLGGLTNLEHLNLSNPCCHLAQHRSHLQGLKDGLCKLTKLRYLNLSTCFNPIFYHHQSKEDSVQYIGECVNSLSGLEHLDLSHNTFLFDLPASLGELNKLKVLNLSGCIRLKKVGEMKSLKFIDLRKCRGLESCQFVVRIVDDDVAYSSSNIAQLEVVNCEELQISCLEKVKSKEEAQRIKLVEKQKLEKLKLSWTLDTVGRVEDSALLGELVPPPNLQCLEVNGYAGTCLPEYLGELTSLQELKIVRCKQLNSLLDTLQKLTSLKDLCIFDCPELEKWCQVEENKKMLAHIPNKNYEEPASTSRQEIVEDETSGNEVEAA